MKKILLQAHCPNIRDATAHYRSLGPLGELHKNYDKLNVEWIDGYDHHFADMSQVLFIQRPFDGSHLQAITIAKGNGIPVIIDYDDDLLSVNTENPAYGLYGKPQVQETIKKILCMVDHVIVSTDVLKEKLGQYAPRITTVENAIHPRMMQWRSKPEYTGKLMYWRGGSSHERDLRSHLASIYSAVETHTDWNFNLLGYHPWFLTDNADKERVKFHDWKPTSDYYRFLAEQGASLCIVPLDDNTFNRSKSNVSYLEAAYAGAACLCPDWDGWRNPGAILYKDKEEFKHKLNLCLTGEIDLQLKAADAWNWVYNCRTLDHVNHKRMEVIRSVL